MASLWPMSLRLMILKRFRGSDLIPNGRRYLVRYRDTSSVAMASGVGLPSQIPASHYFLNFQHCQNTRQLLNMMFIFGRCQPQPGYIWQLWMWFEECNVYLCHIEKFAYGEINERSFTNPHPRPRDMPSQWCWREMRPIYFWNCILGAEGFSFTGKPQYSTRSSIRGKHQEVNDDFWLS